MRGRCGGGGRACGGHTRRRNGGYRSIAGQRHGIGALVLVAVVVHLAAELRWIVAVNATASRDAVVHDAGKRIVGEEVQVVEFRFHSVLVESTATIIALRTEDGHVVASAIVAARDLEQRRGVGVDHYAVAIEAARHSTLQIWWTEDVALTAAGLVRTAGVGGRLSGMSLTQNRTVSITRIAHIVVLHAVHRFAIAFELVGAAIGGCVTHRYQNQ